MLRRFACFTLVWIGAAIPTILVAIPLTALVLIQITSYRLPQSPNPSPAPIWFWTPVDALVYAYPYWAGTYTFWLTAGAIATFALSNVAMGMVDVTPTNSNRHFWRSPKTYFVASLALGVIIAIPWLMALYRFITIRPPG
jgi:hypothetical protein